MQSLVDDNITFAGPLARVNGVEDYMEGIKGMSQIKADIVIQTGCLAVVADSAMLRTRQ
jgi:hypothetical protein